MQPIRRLLIANRGEIAARIIRCCSKLGIHSIAIYSDADRASPYVAAADEAHHLGPSDAPRSYLDSDRILKVAKLTQADAIHPGYGFLSENPAFVKKTREAGIIFIGPNECTMQQLGAKHLARELAVRLDIPVAPGFETAGTSIDEVLTKAKSIELPLLVKAVAGGGGRGMRRVERYEDIPTAIAEAEREAGRSFGDGRLIIERLISPARHIEVQLIGDSHGNVCHLFERDCSIQRSYQKIIEEAPARGLPMAVREKLHQSAIKLGKEVGLVGAATAEFLVPESKGASLEPFYFLEVNPRLQVEHPVTEAITGVDIVELQIKVAAGEALPFKQSKIKATGTAIEARVCAESPANGFRPTTGQIKKLLLPAPSTCPGLRIEHSLKEFGIVSPFYDSLLAKFITHGETFSEAAQLLHTTLGNVVISGLDTNIGFLRRVLAKSDYLKCPPPTIFLDNSPEIFTDQTFKQFAYACGVCLVLGELPLSDSKLINRQTISAGREKQFRSLHLPLTAKSSELMETVAIPPFEVRTEQNQEQIIHTVKISATEHKLRLPIRSKHENNCFCFWDDLSIPFPTTISSSRDALSGTIELFFGPTRMVFTIADLERRIGTTAAEGNSQITSPLPGRVSKIFIGVGGTVEPGTPLLAIESMKMEHNITAATTGVVSNIVVKEGDQVQEGMTLVTIGVSPN